MSGFPAECLEECWLLLNPSKKRSLAAETGCEKENSQPEGLFGLAAPSEQYYFETG